MTKFQVRDLRADEVEFTLQCEPEDLQIEGNFDDPETTSWIRDQLNHGNEWAWCCAIVTAKWGRFKATDSLGGCSYKSEKDFRGDSHFDDMKCEALQRLNEKVRECAESIAKLVE